MSKQAIQSGTKTNDDPNNDSENNVYKSEIISIKIG